MSSHDVLMSHLIAVKRELEQYCEEHEPASGENAKELLGLATLVVSEFTNEKQNG